MKILALTSSQLVFIIVISILLIAVLVFVFLFLIKKKKSKAKFKDSYYSKINEIVQNNDYLLINQFPIKSSENDKIIIDHILCGNKFIYLICDFYYEGDITGNAKDESLILIDEKDNKKYIDNPLMISKNYLTRFAIVSGLDPSLLIGLSLINDNIEYKVRNNSNQFYITQRKELSSFIKKMESSNDLADINEQQLLNAAKILAKLKKENS